MPTRPITALIYSDSDAADHALRTIALELMERGKRLAGLVQHNRPRSGPLTLRHGAGRAGYGRARADSQDRGPHARGCALDVGQLLTAMENWCACSSTPCLTL